MHKINPSEKASDDYFKFITVRQDSYVRYG